MNIISINFSAVVHHNLLRGDATSSSEIVLKPYLNHWGLTLMQTTSSSKA